MSAATTRIPVIVTTPAFELTSEIQNYLHIKYIPLLLKPFDLEPLLQRVRQTLALASQSDMILAGDRNLPVLIVDDSEALCETLSFVLRMEHYQVMTAGDGQMALEALYNNDFCAILLDVDMPVMNGFEFIRAYEQQMRPKAPVVVVSGNSDEIQKGVMPTFVIDVLGKPFEIKELLGVLNKTANRST